MTKTPAEDRTHVDGITESMKRRGLLAAAWAAMAAVVLNRTTQPVEAGVDGDVVLEALNTTNATTSINNTTPGDSAFVAAGTAGLDRFGLVGTGSGNGVFGDTIATGLAGRAGVEGRSLRSNSYGVLGINGVTGGIAVLGQSRSTGVMGQIPTGTIENAIADYGQNYSTYAGPAPGAGGFGVYGLSAKGHGLVGATATAGGAAVVGATNGVVGAYAGALYGPVVVSGDFTVFGAKSAAVPHPDGTHRRLYCVESPESWFEDFGTGRLECGRADVPLDPDFAALVDLSDYHVFVTEQNDHQHLIVRDRMMTGFAVEADADIAQLKGKTVQDVSGTFSWRMVAKRKDITGEGLATVAIPPEPTLPPPVPRGRADASTNMRAPLTVPYRGRRPGGTLAGFGRRDRQVH
jgi:hypothetical protein